MPPIGPYSALNLPAPAKPAVPDQVRAAQRAFFQAALTATPAIQAAAPVTSAPQPVPPVLRSAPPRPDDSDSPGERILRPGSLVDIRV